MKHAERAELKNCSECSGGFFFPEWCLTLKVNTAAPVNLNLQLRAGFFTQKMCGNQAGASLWAEGGEKRPVLLRRVHISLFRVADSPPSTAINPPPPLPGPGPAERRPGGALGEPRRRGVRRSCDWNTDYMNNETETTRKTGNRDQPLR